MQLKLLLMVLAPPMGYRLLLIIQWQKHFATMLFPKAMVTAIG